MKVVAPSCLVLDSITTLPPGCDGAVVLAASHAGATCGHRAAAARLGGVILHDAGIGRDEAGVAGLALLDQVGIPAAAIDHRSARIGDGADCLRRGVISRVNGAAEAVGLRLGMKAEAALQCLSAGTSLLSAPSVALPDAKEARRPWAAAPEGVPVWLLDSNALVKPDDAGAIVITGSHGGLLGGRPESAIKAPVFAAAYNDAGVGADEAGISRLPALQVRGIAGVTVSAASARIGDACSTLADGIVSHINEEAARHGAAIGLPMRECVLRFAQAWRSRAEKTGRT